MLIKALLVVLALVVLAALAYGGLALYSHKAPPLGLVDGRLKPCTSSANCVCSEGRDANIEALAPDGPASDAWARFTAMVIAAGGTVRHVGEGYLHATFESRYLRFVDDLEARQEPASGVIHLRSASRVGIKDRGVNGARVAQLRELMGTAGGARNGTGNSN